jgi:hypothetical protein
MASENDLNDCEPVESNHPLYILYTSGIKTQILKEKELFY